MRAFLAIPADPVWSAAAGPVSARLARDLPRASWTRPESWHLTLKFLGEIPENDAERFARELEPVTAVLRAGSLPTGGSLVLPARGRPRVLAAAFAASEAGAALEELARRADEVAARLGVAPEGRPFRPHVTLARLRDPWPAAAVAEFRSAIDAAKLPPFRCGACVLYASRLHPSGAVHTPVRTLDFIERVEVGA